MAEYPRWYDPLRLISTALQLLLFEGVGSSSFFFFPSSSLFRERERAKKKRKSLVLSGGRITLYKKNLVRVFLLLRSSELFLSKPQHSYKVFFYFFLTRNDLG